VTLGMLCRIDDVVSFVKFLTVDLDYCEWQAFNVTGGPRCIEGGRRVRCVPAPVPVNH
jgi:hypothetical protein